MNKIGLIGGIGPESTVSYYRQIIAGVKERMGEKVLPKICIESLSAFEAFRLCKEQRFDELANYILDGLNNLAAAGARYAALTGNTPNVVIDQLQAKTPIPLISAIDATLAVAKQCQASRIGLLGTLFTMNSTFFENPFKQAGIQIVVPSHNQIEYIQDRIEAELEHGIITKETEAGFVEIITDLRKQHDIEQIILGCTELPMLLNDSNSPVPCLDTVDIHVAALVEVITKAG